MMHHVYLNTEMGWRVWLKSVSLFVLIALTMPASSIAETPENKDFNSYC